MTEFAYLGKQVVDTAPQLDTFALPANVDEVVFETRELTALCPVTGQPDLYHATITFVPRDDSPLGIESKSLKLYLATYRNRGIFAEMLAAELADAIDAAAKPYHVDVVVEQQVRGGLVLRATASRSELYGRGDGIE